MSTPLAGYRKRAPLEAYHIARIVAVALEKCSPSLEIEAKIARKAGVSVAAIQAARENRVSDLSENGQLAREFALAAIGNLPTTEPLRARLVELWGEAAAMEIALGVASARTFPLIRRGLGHMGN